MKAIKTTYFGPTNTKGARIKASDGDRNSVTMNYDHELNQDENHLRAANVLCNKMKWNGKRVMGSFPTYNVHVFLARKG